MRVAGDAVEVRLLVADPGARLRELVGNRDVNLQAWSADLIGNRIYRTRDAALHAKRPRGARLVHGQPDLMMDSRGLTAIAPGGHIDREFGAYALLRPDRQLDLDDIADITSVQQDGKWGPSILLTQSGASRFRQLTRSIVDVGSHRDIDTQLGIFVGDELLANVQIDPAQFPQGIASGQIWFPWSDTKRRVERLVDQLRSAQLPYPLRVESD